jgi:serine/threonine protein kinase
VKLIDFGEATPLSESEFKSQEGKVYKIKSSEAAAQPKGTLNYTPPEMCYDYTATSTSDLWSFACIVFKLLTG